MSRADMRAVFGSIALFMLAGPILVLVNRQILKDTEFKYPMCVSGMGVLCTSIFSHVLIDGLKVGTVNKNRDRSFFLYSCLPVGACQVCNFILPSADSNNFYCQASVPLTSIGFHPGCYTSLRQCGIHIPDGRVHSGTF